MTKTISYSQYSTWRTCPKRWKLQYMDGLYDDSSSIESVFGTAMHNTLEKFVSHLFENEKQAAKTDYCVILLDELKSEFSKFITEDANGNKSYLCSKETLEEYYADGCEIVSHAQKYYKEFFPVKGHDLIGIEVELKKPLLPNAEFIAFLDIVLYNRLTKKYKIIDLKTSRAGWWQQKKDPDKVNQILIYKKYYSLIFNVPEKDIVPEFIILKRKITQNTLYKIIRLSRFNPSHGVVSMNKASKLWDKFIEQCYSPDGDRIDTNVVATPSASNCKYCPFKNNKELCPEGFYKE